MVVVFKCHATDIQLELTDCLISRDKNRFIEY